MRLNSSQVERALSQFDAHCLPDDHPAVAQLNRLFGDHTYFLVTNGLNVLEPSESAETDTQIGKIVNQRLPVEVLSYDPELNAVVPKKVVNWFDNGRTEEFLKFVVAHPGGNGRSQFSCTPNHQIRTPGGWREAHLSSISSQTYLAENRTISHLKRPPTRTGGWTISTPTTGKRSVRRCSRL